MNIEFENPDETFDDFALPEEVEEISSPEPLRFYPWHKPRKQFVRRHQWVHHASSLIEKLKKSSSLNGDTPLKYLSLPGPDLFDVKLMADLCKDHTLNLHYTGFCYVKETEAVRLRRNTQQFEIDRGEQIRPGSGVHVSRLEDITRPGSDASILMKRSGPYDIVNIDACEPIANGDNNQTGRLVDAIRSIVEFQVVSRRQPWVLYLTTPIQVNSVSAGAINALKGEVQKNVENDSEFEKEFFEWVREGETVEEYFSRVSQNDGHEFVRSITLGISKWFVHLAEQANYSVKKMPAYCYSMFRREPFLPNMISTCYLFMPNQISILDQTGLTKNSTSEKTTLPISDHIRALRKSVGIENLDDKMAADPELKQEMVEETKSLLVGAGYDVEDEVNGYEAWLANDPIEKSDHQNSLSP